MIKTRVLLICSVLAIVVSGMLLAGCVRGEGVGSDAQQPQVGLPRVLILGDSISVGYTRQVKELLEGVAEVRRPMTKNDKVINCGSTWMGLDGIEEWLGGQKWDAIHFNWGLWDLCYRKPHSRRNAGNHDKVNGQVSTTIAEYEQNLRQLVAVLKGTGAKLIWASTTPVPEGTAGRKKGDAAKYNLTARKVMEENGILIDDLYSHITSGGQEFFNGKANVHFTKAGCDYLGGQVAAVIAKALNLYEPGKRRTELLWAAGAPGAKGDEDGDKPSITIYLPDEGKGVGAGVVICPGGGYGHLAIEPKSRQLAEWLNSFGVAAFVLKYRHRGTGYGHPAPLQDAQRAIGVVRGKAKMFNIDVARIGVLGFSAGGHLASTAGTLFHTGNPKAVNIFDRASCRPDFMVLACPVISMTQSFTHKASKKRLLGEEPDAELVKKMSSELQVTPATPPTFLAHADDDRVVSPENSVAFYTALRKAKVPAEMHIYLEGGHGFNRGRSVTGAAIWSDRCREWMEKIGVLGK